MIDVSRDEARSWRCVDDRVVGSKPPEMDAGSDLSGFLPHAMLALVRKSGVGSTRWCSETYVKHEADDLDDRRALLLAGISRWLMARVLSRDATIAVGLPARTPSTAIAATAIGLPVRSGGQRTTGLLSIDVRRTLRSAHSDDLVHAATYRHDPQTRGHGPRAARRLNRRRIDPLHPGPLHDTRRDLRLMRKNPAEHVPHVQGARNKRTCNRSSKRLFRERRPILPSVPHHRSLAHPCNVCLSRATAGAS